MTEIPIIFITEDWPIDDVTTEDDCDDAFAVLTALIVSIEARMDDLEIQGLAVSVEYKRAKSALRWKKAAMQMVNNKRGQINRVRADAIQTDRRERVMKYFAAMHPDEFRAAIRHVDAGTDAIQARQA